MMQASIGALRAALGEARADFSTDEMAVNCHHNYVEKEHHYGKNVWVTRKGAVRARKGELGIIPGSMGAKSYIVRGKGNPESFCSCSHGAGRAMSRSAARRRFTVDDHVRMTEGIECRKDAAVIDETPAAYKDHRCRDGRAVRAGRRGAHAAPGRLCKGVDHVHSRRAQRAPLAQQGSRLSSRSRSSIAERTGRPARRSPAGRSPTSRAAVSRSTASRPEILSTKPKTERRSFRTTGSG